MPKFQPLKLLQATGTYIVTSHLATWSVVGLLQVSGYDVGWKGYLTATLVAFAVFGVRASAIVLNEAAALAGRSKPARIHAHIPQAHSGGGRSIPYTRGGRTEKIFLRAVPWLGGRIEDAQPVQSVQPGGATWTVQIRDQHIAITEPELHAFLHGAFGRRSHQFSRTYWTRKRRPPIARSRYEAMMLLLDHAGAITGRTQGSSGWLLGAPSMVIARLKCGELGQNLGNVGKPGAPGIHG